jgi:3D (Asp-Asp-Asp) domain-containing protein
MGADVSDPEEYTLMRRVIGAAAAGVIVMLIILTLYSVARAEDRIPVKITGYCLKGVTADGTEVHEGICAYRRDCIGKIARLYNADGEHIGDYEIHDTGRGGVRKGTVVDVWRPTRAECYALTQQGYVEIINAEEVTDEIIENSGDGTGASD